MEEELAALAHPDSFDIGFAESSRQALWPILHVAMVTELILVLFGPAGLAVRHGAAWGRLGTLGTVLAVPDRCRLPALLSRCRKY